MIPYATDAPIYHWPMATATLIVLNTILFFLVPAKFVEPNQHDVDDQVDVIDNIEGPRNSGPPTNRRDDGWSDADFEQVKGLGAVMVPAASLLPLAEVNSYPAYTLSLEYGNGLKPWQWLTSIFMHAGIMHLVFNMVALWAFGLVVEGKVGAWVFLAIYLGIGVSQSAIEQTAMLLSTNGGGSLGASAAIFGILGVAIIWAPRNDFEVFFGIGFYVTTFEMPIMVYGGYMFIVELLSVALAAFQVSSGILHLMGLVLGLAVGLVWLKSSWVDCEGWDIISVWKGDESGHSKVEEMDDEAKALVRSSLASRSETLSSLSKSAPKPSEKRRREQQTKAAVPEQSEQLFRQSPRGGGQPTQGVEPEKGALLDESLVNAIESGNLTVALKLITSAKAANPGWKPTQQVSGELIRGLLSAKQFDKSLPLMHEHIARFEESRIPLQLSLAKIYLHLERPRRSMAILKDTDREALDDKQAVAFKQLVARAKQMIKQGTIEFQD